MAAKRRPVIRATRRKPPASDAAPPAAAARGPRVSLTWDDLHDLQRDVLKTLRARGVPNLLAVGVGRKNPFRRRAGDLSLIFVVSRCVKKGLKPHQTLGKQKRFEVRMGKGRGARWVNLASDVIDLKSLRAVPVASRVSYGGNFGTAGLVVRWAEGNQRRWGVLTAAHVVTASDDPDPVLRAQDQTKVDVLSLTFVAAADTAPFDAAILRIRRDDVTTLNNTLDPDGEPLVPDNTINFEGTADDGACRTRAGDIPIDIQAAFGQVSVSGWPNLISLLGFKSNDKQTEKPFKSGNSGSAVRLTSGAPLGMLVAAVDKTFDVGWTQPLAPLLKHLQQETGVTSLEILGYC